MLSSLLQIDGLDYIYLPGRHLPSVLHPAESAFPESRQQLEAATVFALACAVGSPLGCSNAPKPRKWQGKPAHSKELSKHTDV
jgi:hypothetical protein